MATSLVFVGNGMSAVACVEELLKNGQDFDITIFGDEPHTNYDRALLPSVLAGLFLVIGFHRVLVATVPSAIIRCIAVIGFSLAPLMLDFSIAARGYSLGLALLACARPVPPVTAASEASPVPRGSGPVAPRVTVPAARAAGSETLCW